MNANGGADAGHKRRLENRLMVRRRDPYGSRQRGPRVRRTFESVLRSRSILPRASGHRGNIEVLDLTGRRGSFTRSSLLCFLIGQIRKHDATQQYLLAQLRLWPYIGCMVLRSSGGKPLNSAAASFILAILSPLTGPVQDQAGRRAKARRLSTEIQTK